MLLHFQMVMYAYENMRRPVGMCAMLPLTEYLCPSVKPATGVRAIMGIYSIAFDDRAEEEYSFLFTDESHMKHTNELKWLKARVE